MTDFFISYTGADRAWAEWIDWQLRDASYSTVVQAFDFQAGSNFVVEMDRAAREAERTITVLSPDFLKSSFTSPEWTAAFASDPKGQKRQLVPVQVRKCELSGLLAQIVYIDLVGAEDGEAARQRLLDGLRPAVRPTEEPNFPGAASNDVASNGPRFPGTSQPPRAVEPPPELSADDYELLRFVANYRRAVFKTEMETETEAEMGCPPVKTKYCRDRLYDAAILERAPVSHSGFTAYGWGLSKKGRVFWMEDCQQGSALAPAMRKCDHCNEEVALEAIKEATKDKTRSTGRLFIPGEYVCPNCGEELISSSS